MMIGGRRENRDGRTRRAGGEIWKGARHQPGSRIEIHLMAQRTRSKSLGAGVLRARSRVTLGAGDGIADRGGTRGLARGRARNGPLVVDEVRDLDGAGLV